MGADNKKGDVNMKRKILSATICVSLLLAACEKKEQVVEKAQMQKPTISECAADVEKMQESSVSKAGEETDIEAVLKSISNNSYSSVFNEREYGNMDGDTVNIYEDKGERVDTQFIWTISAGVYREDIPLSVITTKEELQYVDNYTGGVISRCFEDYSIEEYDFVIEDQHFHGMADSLRLYEEAT